VRAVLLILGGLLGAFVLGVALFNFVIMPRLVQHNVTVRVPRLVGIELAEAQDRCDQLGLNLQIEDRRYSEGVAPDQVLNQAPGAGMSVKRGRTVRVHVSLGAQLVTVPDVRGMTLRQASLQLDNANLDLGRISRIYVGEGGQVVQATRPRSGSGTVAGKPVDLLVAVGEGAEPFLMPNLVGRALEEVRELIETRGFRIGRVTYRSKKGVYPGTVLEHYPAGGSLILRGESIDLVAATPD
jgi:serine/threonine-protein kinase